MWLTTTRSRAVLVGNASKGMYAKVRQAIDFFAIGAEPILDLIRSAAGCQEPARVFEVFRLTKAYLTDEREVGEVLAGDDGVKSEARGIKSWVVGVHQA